jgi:hypothetical protein
MDMDYIKILDIGLGDMWIINTSDLSITEI